MSDGPRPFRPIASAPPDTNVEVVYGERECVALARFDSRLQIWVRVEVHEGRRRLLRVTGWRPVPAGD
jgi:hypothetical protein